MLRGGADSTQKWDNFQLLKEAKTLRRSKDFENSYYILSKMHLGNDPFVSFKHFLELGNWFHCSGRFGAAIEIFNSLIREQKNPQLLAKVTSGGDVHCTNLCRFIENWRFPWLPRDTLSIKKLLRSLSVPSALTECTRTLLVC